ncbi:MAG: glycosyl hydrolase family 28 protein [Chitinophagaceae bacterium]
MKRLCIKTILLLFASIFMEFEAFAKRTIDVTSIGIKNDGITNNTILFQKIVNNNSYKNTVLYFPAGRYLLGPTILKSDIEIRLDTNATILASTNRLDYGHDDAQALFYAKNERNIILSGKGTIDGQGTALVTDLYQKLESGTITDPTWKTFNPWFQKRPTESNRPKILFFDQVYNIVIDGITIKNGSSWIQDYRNCEKIVINNIKVKSNCYWNNDGIDIVDSKNVVLQNSFFDVADDGICLKSESPDRKCEDIVIDNCKVRSSASAIKLGTASWGGFENIKIKNIHVYDTYRSAIAIESVDGGTVKNIEVENIDAVNTGNGIFIKLGNRNKTNNISQLENIVLKNIKVRIPSSKPDNGYPMEGPVLKFSPLVLNAPETQDWLNRPDIDTSIFQYPHNVFPSSISGLPKHPVKNIRLENIELIYEGGGNKSKAYYPLDSAKFILEGEKYYPEFSMFGELPVSGLYVRHAEKLSFNNVTIRFTNPDFRVVTLFEDVNGLNIQKMNIIGIPKERWMHKIDVQDITFKK